MCDLRGAIQKKVDTMEASCMPNAMKHEFLYIHHGHAIAGHHPSRLHKVKCITLDMVFDVTPCTTNPSLHDVLPFLTKETGLADLAASAAKKIEQYTEFLTRANMK